MDAESIVRLVLDTYGNRINDHCGCHKCSEADRLATNKAVEALASAWVGRQS